ncbi:MAG: MarR family transcriptional regulator [Nanoarchaeota archaeon]|nr:MarR family transcriptional regulator [Nanoarchaeota archaeon]MBU1320925.1 MarR family transcriptional regulator [Nanoarchaeota archaeon]MBU1597550.1 MarR family transcriptional regulator [Nanoarchaeota archaeon]MBU2441947.1 MarR family transcriptional regulator [Nanoarchaeota archaeon]
MRNKTVGLIIIGIAILIGFIIFSFNRAMTSIVSTSCSHGLSCPMWGTINFQTNVGIGIMVFVILVGLYLVFFGREKEVITKVKTVKEQVKPKNITKENFKDVMKDLNEDEKKVLETIIEAEGTIFQSDLVDKSGFTKVKVTRILDKLEGKNILERKRRGMTNVVILNH